MNDLLLKAKDCFTRKNFEALQAVAKNVLNAGNAGHSRGEGRSSLGAHQVYYLK